MSKRVTYLFLALIASFSLLGCGSDVPTSLSTDGSITPPPTDDNVGPPTDDKPGPPTDEKPPPTLPPENPINGLYTSTHYLSYMIIDDIDTAPFIAVQNYRGYYIDHKNIVKVKDLELTSNEVIDGSTAFKTYMGYTLNTTIKKDVNSSFTLSDGKVVYAFDYNLSGDGGDYFKAANSLSLKELNGTHISEDGATYTINEIDASLAVDAINGCNFSGTLTFKNGMYTMPSVEVTKCTNADAYLNGTYKGFLYTDVKADGTKYMMINMRNDKDTIWGGTPLQ